MADLIWDELSGCPAPFAMVDPLDVTRRRQFEEGTDWKDLLVPVVRGGQVVYAAPPLSEVRARAREQLERFHPAIKRFLHPHEYPVGLEAGLHQRKLDLTLAARQRAQDPERR